MPRGTRSITSSPSIQARAELEVSQGSFIPGVAHSYEHHPKRHRELFRQFQHSAAMSSQVKLWKCHGNLMRHSQPRTGSPHSELRLGTSPHQTRRECMRYRALTPSPRLVPPNPPVGLGSDSRSSPHGVRPIGSGTRRRGAAAPVPLIGSQRRGHTPNPTRVQSALSRLVRRPPLALSAREGHGNRLGSSATTSLRALSNRHL